MSSILFSSALLLHSNKTETELKAGPVTKAKQRKVFPCRPTERCQCNVTNQSHEINYISSFVSLPFNKLKHLLLDYKMSEEKSSLLFFTKHNLLQDIHLIIFLSFRCSAVNVLFKSHNFHLAASQFLKAATKLWLDNILFKDLHTNTCSSNTSGQLTVYNALLLSWLRN